jgi:glucosamine--fructose-6-phosphate aminotransferase (isomerizing)
VVHNGIIENHEEIRARLQSQGYEFTSDTDTEVIAHLVHSCLRPGVSLFDAVQAAAQELVGAYAIAVIRERHCCSASAKEETSPLRTHRR